MMKTARKRVCVDISVEADEIDKHIGLIENALTFAINRSKDRNCEARAEEYSEAREWFADKVAFEMTNQRRSLYAARARKLANSDWESVDAVLNNGERVGAFDYQRAAGLTSMIVYRAIDADEGLPWWDNLPGGTIVSEWGAAYGEEIIEAYTEEMSRNIEGWNMSEACNSQDRDADRPAYELEDRYDSLVMKLEPGDACASREA